MKKVLLCMIALILFAVPLMAADFTPYNVTISTDAITDGDTMAAQISGEARIARMVLSNREGSAHYAILYKDSGDTNTVTAVLGPIEIPANSNTTLTWDYGRELSITDFCIRGSTPTSLNAYIEYR